MPGVRSTTSSSAQRPSRVTIEIAPFKDQVRLTVTHDDFDEGSVVFEKITEGWPAVLSSLKSYLETGHSLPNPSRNAAPQRRRTRIDTAAFKPKTVYVTYIAATPDKVWQALTDPAS